MPESRADLAGHPDRIRWNARYGQGSHPSFMPHPLAARALSMPLPDGPVADLACGPSGAALLAAGAGRHVTAVDVSEVALSLLGEEAARRGLAGLITLVQADLTRWHPRPDRYALAVCTGYWDRDVFGAVTGAVAPGGLLAWEAFTAQARSARPGLPAQWCLGPGEPAALLPGGFEVIDQHDLPDAERGTKRLLLARRHQLCGARPVRRRTGAATTLPRAGACPAGVVAGQAPGTGTRQADARVCWPACTRWLRLASAAPA
jgi:SAM-dependent methyltransferase